MSDLFVVVVKSAVGAMPCRTLARKWVRSPGSLHVTAISVTTPVVVSCTPGGPAGGGIGGGGAGGAGGGVGGGGGGGGAEESVYMQTYRYMSRRRHVWQQVGRHGEQTEWSQSPEWGDGVVVGVGGWPRERQPGCWEQSVAPVDLLF